MTKPCKPYVDGVFDQLPLPRLLYQKNNFESAVRTAHINCCHTLKMDAHGVLAIEWIINRFDTQRH